MNILIHYQYGLYFQANVERPEVVPLSSDEAQRILKRKRDDLELAEIDEKLREHSLRSLEMDAKFKAKQR